MIWLTGGLLFVHLPLAADPYLGEIFVLVIFIQTSLCLMLLWVVYCIATTTTPQLSSAKQSAISATESHETLGFTDSTMGTSVGFTTRNDPTREAMFSGADHSLAAFFARPITIATYTWTPLQAAPFSAVIAPWSLFFGNKRVINRINNYASMTARLHVRFLINGNGFYYGRLMADYHPLPASDTTSSVNTLEPRNAIAASQRLKVFIDPSDCCSQQLDLPFVLPTDALGPSQFVSDVLGKIYVRELTQLKHANGAVQPLTITVMAWATDVHLANPTCLNATGLVVQAGDEYGSTPVANLATAVAASASALTQVPVVGPYARATSMMAGAAARMATSLGWSRPPVISPLTGVKPTAMSALAPCDAGDNVIKLTVDSKQELTVDPSVIGVELSDELNLASIAARESYLTSFSWTTGAVSGDLIWNSAVTPMLLARNGADVYLPACAFATWPFRFWRGKVRFRFQVVASAYHRGRLRLVWDPNTITSLESNVQYQRIVDVSTDRDVTVEVEWGCNQHFLTFDSSIPQLYGTTSIPVTPASNQVNGVLGIFVMSTLATPNSTVNNDIFVNVFVSCNDIELAAPQALPLYATFNRAVEQAGDMDVANDGNEPGCGDTSTTETFAHCSDVDNTALVYMGERITSFRQLLRRYTVHSMLRFSGAASSGSFLSVGMYNMPEFYGYASSLYAMHATTLAKPFNYVSNHILHYLAPAFVGMRGSLRTKYAVTTSSPVRLAVELQQGVNTSMSRPLPTTLPAFTTTQSGTARQAMTSMPSTLAPGGAMTLSSVSPAIEVEFPDYNATRFRLTRTLHVTGDTNSLNGTVHTLHLLAVSTSPFLVERMVSVGEDFSLLWFQGCPPLTLLASPT